ncbi:MAG: hypothetical protein HKO73_15235 [Woeseiaceae bacterium]|nr:hypothetical protein [Woeseiaceae bacterium]
MTKQSLVRTRYRKPINYERPLDEELIQTPDKKQGANWAEDYMLRAENCFLQCPVYRRADSDKNRL